MPCFFKYFVVCCAWQAPSLERMEYYFQIFSGATQIKVDQNGVTFLYKS